MPVERLSLELVEGWIVEEACDIGITIGNTPLADVITKL
jgi:hypothetical protein